MKNTTPIYVTKSFIPPIQNYIKYIEEILERGVLTNQGPCVEKLEKELEAFLRLEDLQFITNGTVAIQLALNALDITEGEIITTPFSYVATVTSILWERCTPVFVDIEPDNFTIDVTKIEQAITANTKAILPVHVFGYACDVEKIQEIATKHNLKVIYDGAHAFASEYKGRSLLSYGDIATLSFHSTKLFHTVEGGAIVANSEEMSKKVDLIKRFGQKANDFLMVGINAKQSEVHAAMGLANLPHLDEIIRERKRVVDLYDAELSGLIQRPAKQDDLKYNYAYYPALFKSEKELLHVFEALEAEDIFARRYFLPSLNNLSYLPYQRCPISEDVSSRIACLPLYPTLSNEDVLRVIKVIKTNLF